MIGTIANTLAIIVGSAVGSVAKRGLGERYQDVLFLAMGLAAVGIGINAIVTGMADSIYPVLFIASLAIGGVIGTGLDIAGRFDRFVSKRSKSKGEDEDESKVKSENNLSQGLSTAIMLFCFGALSILGPINSALNGDETYLFTNAMLDLVTSMVLASSFGFGIAFAAAVLFCWQGSIFLLANQLAPLLTTELMSEITIVGGFLVLASGLGILKVKEIPVMNLLPSIFVPPLWFAIVALVQTAGVIA
ncbi:MAG: DUF554 domain-containing protein [Eggerthellaceae bacterium]|nr:DUF554 domain-containing protein [Eggerthellaceae bacterium]